MTVITILNSSDPNMEWFWTLPRDWYGKSMDEARRHTPQGVGSTGRKAPPTQTHKANIYIVRGNSWAPLDPIDYDKPWTHLIQHLKRPPQIPVFIRQPIDTDPPTWRLKPRKQQGGQVVKPSSSISEEMEIPEEMLDKMDQWEIIDDDPPTTTGGGGGGGGEAPRQHLPHQQQLDERRLANPFRDLLACSSAVHEVYNITEGKTTFSKKSVRVPGATFHMDHQVTNIVRGQMSEVAVVGRLEFSPHDVRGIVAFRGTLLSPEWFSNALPGLSKTHGHMDIRNIISGPPTVIRSTHNTLLYKNAPQQVNVLRTLEQRILGEIEKYKGLDRWLITGHSRGAAFATAIAEKVCQRFPDKMFTLLTMAGMPYGRDEFNTQLATKCKKNLFAYHYFSKLDVIPTMNAFRRYFPPHEQIDIRLDYTSRFDFEYYHSLDRYLDFARCMIKIQNLLQRWIREMDSLWTGDIPPLDLLLGQRVIQDLLLSTTRCTLSPRLRLKVLERVYKNFQSIYLPTHKFKAYHEYFQLLTFVLLAKPPLVHMFLQCTTPPRDSHDPSDPLSTHLTFIRIMMMKDKVTPQQHAPAIQQSLAKINQGVPPECKLFYQFLEKFITQMIYDPHVPLSSMAPRQFHYAYPPRLHSGSIQKQYELLYPGGDKQWEVVIDSMEAFYTFLNEHEFLPGITPSMILRDPVLMFYWVDRFEKSKQSPLVKTQLYETMERWIRQQSQSNVNVVPPTTPVILASSSKKLETLMGSSTTFMEAVKRCILYHDKQRLELLLYYFLTLPAVVRNENIPPHSSMDEKMDTIAQVRKLLFSPQQQAIVLRQRKPTPSTRTRTRHHRGGGVTQNYLQSVRKGK